VHGADKTERKETAPVVGAESKAGSERALVAVLHACRKILTVTITVSGRAEGTRDGAIGR